MRDIPPIPPISPLSFNFICLGILLFIIYFLVFKRNISMPKDVSSSELYSTLNEIKRRLSNLEEEFLKIKDKGEYKK